MTLAERFFKEELEVFENDDIQEFCIELLDTAPTYFWQVSASSTNKYHPDYTVGFMGLLMLTAKIVKHQLQNHMTLVQFLRQLLIEKFA